MFTYLELRWYLSLNVSRVPTFTFCAGARSADPAPLPAYPPPVTKGSLSWRFSTLPEPVFGNSSAKVTERGTL